MLILSIASLFLLIAILFVPQRIPAAMTHFIATAKLGRTGQTSIPKCVRRILALDTGDMLRFARDGDAIILSKLDFAGLASPLAHITEWSGDDDAQTFAQL